MGESETERRIEILSQNGLGSRLFGLGSSSETGERTGRMVLEARGVAGIW